MYWPTEWHQIVGVLGTVAYLGSYFLIQLGAIRVRSYLYCLTNIAAASLVGISLFFEFNLASCLIQVSWILISLVGIAKISSSQKHERRIMRRKVKIACYPR